MRKLSKLLEFHYLERGRYPSVTVVVEAMNKVIQEGHNHNENQITVEKSRRTQKKDFYLANEESGIAFFDTHLRHISKVMLAMNAV